jgi:hypothetical protein
MADAEITLWGRRSSCNVQKALWALEELGLAYERIEAGGDSGGLDTPDYLAMNPHGRVPTLRDGDTVVWESDTINAPRGGVVRAAVRTAGLSQGGVHSFQRPDGQGELLRSPDFHRHSRAGGDPVPRTQPCGLPRLGSRLRVNDGKGAG